MVLLMSFSRRPGHPWRIVTVLALGAGCLPLGNPPAGQHLLADRTAAAVFLTRSGIEGGPPNLFVFGPPQQVPPFGVPGADLFAFAYPSDSGPIAGLANRPPTIANVVLRCDAASGLEPGEALATYVSQTDSRGRLVFVTLVVEPGLTAEYVARYDFLTGERQDLAPALAADPGFRVSASRTRIFAGSSVFELDGVTDLGTLGAAPPAFIGDDLYYTVPASSDALAGGSVIKRSRAATTPETMLSSVGTVTFTPIYSDTGGELLVSSASENGDVPYLVLGIDRPITSVLPPARGQAPFVSASSDGQWLLFREPRADGNNRLFLFNWVSGSAVSWTSSWITALAEWRPGWDQLWFVGLSPAGAAVGNPNTDEVSANPGRIPVSLPFLPDARTSMFTRDGNHWLSVELLTANTGAPPRMYLGSADDPAAPGIALNQQGQALLSLWETGDGRLLAGSSSVDVNRQDIYLVDPVAGTSRGLAGGGHVVGIGRGRALALLNWQIPTSTGDLTLIDLATGTKTVLAEDVYSVAVDPGVPADARLAPGTTVAFLVRNRLASPYDGLWVAHLP
jgi:hypothetical protein